MADYQDKQENSPKQEKPPLQEQIQPAEQRESAIEIPEAKRERIVSDELKREIEMLKLDKETEREAEKKAEEIDFLAEKDKIEHLLQIAKERGVVFAIRVARRTNEPYLLDVLHDTLAREGYYKDFTN